MVTADVARRRFLALVCGTLLCTWTAPAASLECQESSPTGQYVRVSFSHETGAEGSGVSAGGGEPLVVLGTLATFGSNLLPPNSLNLAFAAASGLSNGKEVYEGCEAADYAVAIPTSSAVVVQRGNCSFTHKAMLAANTAHARALIVVNNVGGDAVPFTMGCASSETTSAMASVDNILALMISEESGLALREKFFGVEWQEHAVVELEFIDTNSGFDASAMILFLVAVGTVAVGSLVANGGLSRSPYEPTQLDSNEGSAVQARDEEHKDNEVVHLSATWILFFLVFASAMLVFLFYFLNDALLMVLIVAFTIGSTLGLHQLLAMSVYHLCRSFQHRMPHLIHIIQPVKALKACFGKVTYCDLLTFPCAVGVGVTWAIYYDVDSEQRWTWILQDVLGVSLIVSMFRSLRLPDMRIACVFIPALVVYDVFWVFFSDRFFGSSVMVKVAQGGEAHESLPFLLKVPHFVPKDDRGLLPLQFSILGFGDVVLPGLLVSFALSFDHFTKKCTLCAGYFIHMVLAYSTGLALTYVALFVMRGQGQPALLYLGPSTLGCLVLLGKIRGELPLLWRGIRPTEGTDSNPDSSDSERTENSEGEDVHEDDGTDKVLLDVSALRKEV
mmetsp:Transcript_7047/g.25960  ORF Transcript_7047/g.25960 Transcript_7047/m.25960 type:complete len:615 (+) Transcript_7047:76-1920(+)|eukprot:scaffold2631_cov412-Prasinococcus_capsulatus_cf.AAC.6